MLTAPLRSFAVSGDMGVIREFIFLGGRKQMTLRKLAEIGVKLGAATLVGLDELQHKRTEEKPRKSFLRPSHVVLCSSLIVAGLALWEMKKHHHLGA